MAQVSYRKIVQQKHKSTHLTQSAKNVTSMFFITVLFLFCLFHELLPHWMARLKHTKAQSDKSSSIRCSMPSLRETRVLGVNAQNSRSLLLSGSSSRSRRICAASWVGSRGLEQSWQLSLLPPLFSTGVPPCPPGL